ncbi:MAG TPA: hypothetical protein VIV60_36890, partial [Polyangiaceae bacterium]
PFKAARDAAEELARALTDRIPSLRIELYPQPASEKAALTIDGARVPIAAVGLPYTLNPTEHLLTVSAPGYRSVERRFALSPGESKALRIELTPLTSSDEPRGLRNGQVAPPFGAIAVQASSDQRESAELGWPVWLGIGLAAAGVSVGAVAGIVSLERTKSAKAYCHGNDCSPSARADRDAAMVSANISNVGFAIGLVGATIGVTSIGLAHSGAKQPSHTAVTLGISSLPAGAALHLDGAIW